MRSVTAVGVLVAVVSLLVAAVSPTFAGSPGRDNAKLREDAKPGCNGLVNAYAHGAPVADVAAAHGCDLTGITPAQHPNDGDADKDGDEQNESDEDADAGDGPPADVVAAKCDHIADRLAAAEARTHGNSAAAFTRQADKWSCPD